MIINASSEDYYIINIFLLVFFLSTQYLLLNKNWMENWVDNLFLISFSFLLSIWQHTSLFILSHDIHHLRKQTKFDILMGNIALLSYAGFTLPDFSKKHSLHHQYPGISGKDPDYLDGTFFPWYLSFMTHYISIQQLIFVYFKFLLLFHYFPSFNVYLFSVLPSILSSLQLFYFGTFSVHGNNGKILNSSLPPWVIFLTSFNFGYHKEHHDHPDIKWYLLQEFKD